MCLFVCLWGGSAGRGRKRSWFKETAPTTSCPSFKRWVLVFKTIIFFKGTSNSTKKISHKLVLWKRLFLHSAGWTDVPCSLLFQWDLLILRLGSSFASTVTIARWKPRFILYSTGFPKEGQRLHFCRNSWHKCELKKNSPQHLGNGAKKIRSWGPAWATWERKAGRSELKASLGYLKQV